MLVSVVSPSKTHGARWWLTYKQSIKSQQHSREFAFWREKQRMFVANHWQCSKGFLSFTPPQCIKQKSSWNLLYLLSLNARFFLQTLIRKICKNLYFLGPFLFVTSLVHCLHFIIKHLKARCVSARLPEAMLQQKQRSKGIFWGAPKKVHLLHSTLCY